MPNCMEQVYSEEYYDFLIPYGVEAEVPSTPGCVQRIAEDYDIFFYPREGLPPLSIGNYTYTAIPKCYALLDTTALDASGITRLQNQPVLALKGEGVLVGVIDTGVDYTNPLFRYSDGSSRILRIWDQTIQDGTPPEGILYGAEYRKEEIDEALQKKQPYDVVPSRDENGHGTFVTGVVCGGEDIPNGFIGAVPNAGIAVVKSVEFFAPFPAGCRIVPLRRFPCIFQITPPDPAERIIDRQQARQHGLVVNSSAETAIIDRIRRAGHADPIAGPDDDGLASAIPGCGSSGFRAVGHQVVLVVFRLPPMAECARFADHDVESRAVLP